MHIHQLSINYLQEHDRILVRINTQESAQLRLWFTRKLTLSLMPLMSDIVAQHVAQQEAIKSSHISPSATADLATQQLLTEFKNAEHLQKSDFVTPFKDQTSRLPLGQEPLLVTEVKITPLPSGQLKMVFSEKLPVDGTKPRSFSVAMEANLTHGFMHLLGKAIAVSMWRGIVPPSDLRQQSNSATDLSGAKPKYWN